ncbi:MAG: hypothetical protein QXQ11_08770 [Candidatus Bathyarchaeia archaeon]
MKKLKETFRKSEADKNIAIGILTIERVNMMRDTTTGTLRRVERFILN